MLSWSKSNKNYLSSDYGLKLAHMKVESLVIVKQHVTVNLFLGFVQTARHILEVGLFLNKSIF